MVLESINSQLQSKYPSVINARQSCSSFLSVGIRWVVRFSIYFSCFLITIVGGRGFMAYPSLCSQRNTSELVKWQGTDQGEDQKEREHTWNPVRHQRLWHRLEMPALSISALSSTYSDLAIYTARYLTESLPMLMVSSQMVSPVMLTTAQGVIWLQIPQS